MPLVQGIIDTVNLPKLTALVHSTSSPFPLTNPYSGLGTLPTLSGGVPAYGIAWHSFGGPPQAGRATRAIVYYEDLWLNLVTHYELADLNQIIGENVLTGDDRGFMLFEHGQPIAVVYDILSGYSVNFTWLITP